MNFTETPVDGRRSGPFTCIDRLSVNPVTCTYWHYCTWYPLKARTVPVHIIPEYWQYVHTASVIHQPVMLLWLLH